MDKPDILEVAKKYCKTLIAKGSKYWACCPVHHEKVPSFTLSQEYQNFKCWGCGASGDSISLVMQVQHCDFQQALEILRTMGFKVQSSSSRREGTNLVELRAVVEKFIHASRYTLMNQLVVTNPQWVEVVTSDESQSIKDFLVRRGLDIGDLYQFNIGYVPWELDQFNELGELGEDLVKLGVGGSPEELFRGRILFPISDRFGRICGATARSLRQGTIKTKKYVNSSESEVFQKGKTLYHLHEAMESIQSSGRLIIVEGPMDVVRMAKCGFPNTVSTLGTSMTEEQIELVLKTGAKAVLFGDGDEAGEVATLKRGVQLLTSGVPVYVIPTPTGEDPDSLGRQDPKALEVAVAFTTSFPRFRLSKAINEDPQARLHAITQFQEELSGAPKPVQETLLLEAGEILHLKITLTPKKNKPAPIRPKRIEAKLPRIEQEILWAISLYEERPETILLLWNAIGQGHGLSGRGRTLARSLMGAFQGEGVTFQPEDKEELTMIFQRFQAVKDSWDWDNFIEKATSWLKESHLRIEVERSREQVTDLSSLTSYIEQVIIHQGARS